MNRPPAETAAEGYTVIENGLNGRTTAFADTVDPWIDGMKSIGYELLSQKPLDLVILFLGTNDFKFTDAVGVRRGMNRLIRMTKNADTVFDVSQPIFPTAPKSW